MGAVIKDLTQWRAQIASEFESLHRQVSALALTDETQIMLALALLPIHPQSADDARALARLLDSSGICPLLSAYWMRVSRQSPFVAPPLAKLIPELLSGAPQETRAHFDRLIEMTGVKGLRSRALFSADQAAVGKKTKADSRERTRQPERRTSHKKSDSPSTEMKMDSVIAGGSVLIAGQNATMVQVGDDKARDALRDYLAKLRADWVNLDMSSIISDPAKQVHMLLYDLFTPLDIWNPKLLPAQIDNLRRRENQLDLTTHRVPIIQALARDAHLVITGGPGTGKSALSGFVTICMTYACDPHAEQRDGIKGLERLGPDWKHGAVLPIYVDLRSFCGDAQHFPPSANRKANADNLLSYIRGKAGDFAPYLTRYLDGGEGAIKGAMLLLDGLDEIYEKDARINACSVIAGFAARYPHCRIVVTCRAAAYRQGAEWRLPDQFSTVELAPYTWGQISHYIDQWYALAVQNRPRSFSPHHGAVIKPEPHATNLKQALREQRGLVSLARQPLLLTLIALIHEKYHHLPDNRGELYRETVQLLEHWNLPNEDDPLAKKYAAMNRQGVRQALQLIAFMLQLDRSRSLEDASIARSVLITQLVADVKRGGKLGASIEDLLEYLATRNGILVADHTDSYRFLHLSIQEYMAGCALIEQFNEVQMPRPSKPPFDVWSFPDNVCALLNEDPLRWREVALFCGAILGRDTGQERLWNYVETLLPTWVSVSPARQKDKPEEGDVYRILVAGEVWADNHLVTRLDSHRTIQSNLTRALTAIKNYDKLDAPEVTQIEAVLRQLREANAR
jgi:hypothetical protein